MRTDAQTIPAGDVAFVNASLDAQIETLFQPFTCRSLTIPNRTVMAPMGRAFATDHTPSSAAPAYYRRRVEGGVGLVITEANGIDHSLLPDSSGVPVLHGAARDTWREVVEAVHAAGGKIVAQLFHQGMLRGGGASDPQMTSLRPSGSIGVAGRTSFSEEFISGASISTRPMNDSEIQEIIDGFARSSRIAVELGFDGVEIHGAHGYVIDSFLWSQSNRRTDRWGGSPQRRTALAVEVVKVVRGEIGDERPLLFRFSQHKSSNYDARNADNPAELEEYLGPIVDAGVDILDASIRRFYEPAFNGSHLNLAGWAKKLTGRPSIAVGSIGLSTSATDTFLHYDGGLEDNISLLMERFASGEFDLVAIGRSLIADPNFVRKLRSREPYVPFTRAALETLV